MLVKTNNALLILKLYMSVSPNSDLAMILSVRMIARGKRMRVPSVCFRSASLFFSVLRGLSKHPKREI